MSETTLTHKDLGRMLGVSETTIKSYRRKFPDCIPVANDGKPIRFTQQAGTVCLRIRELFSRGMSVPEVRARLEREFSWIEPLPEQEDAVEEAVEEAAQPLPVTGPVEVELPDDYTQALSGLAKSMVNLTMKQDTILRKMDSIDARLKQLGLEGADLATAKGGPAAQSAVSPEMHDWLEQASALLERLTMLESDMRHSVWAGQSEAGKSAEKTVRVRNAYGDVSEYTLQTTAGAESAATVSATDVTDTDDSFIFDDMGDDVEAVLEAEANARAERQTEQAAQQPQEPPRALLTMPLVIQSPDGEYLGVAGRTRGRFSINDLKAMLMNHYSGVERYTSSWQYTENGWLMTLEQREATDPYVLALLVNQTTTPRGNNVALIEHLTICGKDENPVEMYNFINKIYES